MTDANGRKYITTEPAPQPDWKEEYLKAVELHCITLDELCEGMTLNRKLEKTIAAQHVIKVLDAQIQHLVRCEREACAEVIDKHLKNWASLAGKDKAYKWLEKIAVTIRARGNTNG
jgi:flagellar biosynthesis chaperone FliJ